MSRKENAPKVKKPLLRRWWFWVVLALVLIGAFGNNTKQAPQEPVSAPMTTPEVTDTPTEAPTSEPTEAPTVEPTEAPTEAPTAAPTEVPDQKEVIEQTIAAHVKAEYRSTDIDRITVNDDLGTDAPDDYIALVYLVWNVKNKPDMTRQMLTLYSDDLAATLGKTCADVQEVAVFWTVPYLGSDAKRAYERRGEGMYSTDTFWGGQLTELR